MNGSKTVSRVNDGVQLPGVLGLSWASEASLRDLGVVVRPQVTDDAAFLHSLVRSRRSLEIGFLPWPEAQKDIWVSQQCHAQEHGYRSDYPKACWLMICRDDRPIGRLVLDLRDNCLTVVDIAVLSSHQGLGIGSTLLSALLRLADRLGLSCHLQVEPHNAAQRLYARMGFEVRSSEGLHIVMERSPIRLD